MSPAAARRSSPDKGYVGRDFERAVAAPALRWFDRRARTSPPNPCDGRHTYASLLSHAGRSPLAVAASLGHASAETTRKHYAHLIDEARLASSTDPEAAVWSARRAVSAGDGVREMCADAPRRHLRLVS
jgi:integrase